MLKYFTFFLVIFLAVGCSTQQGSFSSRQSECLVELKRELGCALRDLGSTKSKVIGLKEEIARKEIDRIRKEINLAHMKSIVRDFHFAKDREILTEIIATIPKYSKDAQIVLDAILVHITELSNNGLR